MFYSKHKLEATRLGTFKRSARIDDETSDTSSALTRASTPIMLEYHEPPDPFVPAAEWAVVNVSGQRFQINMKHIKDSGFNTIAISLFLRNTRWLIPINKEQHRGGVSM